MSQLFVEAAHVGIAVEQRSVSSEELQVCPNGAGVGLGWAG